MNTRPTAVRFGPDAGAAIRAGLIAGVFFLLIQTIMQPLFFGNSPWDPTQRIAAILLGGDILSPPARFDAGTLLAAIFVHFPLSILYALILALLVHRLDRMGALVTGAAFGVVLYLVNYFGFTGMFPWFAPARNWVTILSHLTFGMVAGWSYVALQRPMLVMTERYIGVERRHVVASPSLWTGPERRRA